MAHKQRNIKSSNIATLTTNTENRNKTKPRHTTTTRNPDAAGRNDLANNSITKTHIIDSVYTHNDSVPQKTTKTPTLSQITNQNL